MEQPPREAPERPALQDGPPAEIGAGRTSGKPPAPLNSLVGRARELAELNALLSSGPSRLVIITGPGGVGKTRLALQIGARAHRAFADGAFFVPLAAIADPALLLPTIAQTLGVREGAGTPLLSTLCAALQRKHLLLILDNFEQITAAAADVIGLLACSPRLAVLVTSRATLHVHGAQHYPLAPLNLPAAASAEQWEQLSQYEAVALFIARARAARPDFNVNNRNAPAVAEICRRLDGLPLALELAAARTAVLSPQALLKRLDRRLPLLASTAANLPRRHQTLRDAIAWSYDLLSPAEQANLRCLAVFAGGWTLDAALAVCGPRLAAGAAAADEEQAQLAALTALADKSLLWQDEQEDGEPRFAMLETIREFALDELARSDEAEPARERHARFFMALAEQAARELEGHDQGPWLDKLQLEHDNLRAAMLYAQQSGAGEVGLRIAIALARFWRTRGYINEGKKWLVDMLASAAGTEPALRAKVLTHLGILAGAQSDYEEARGYLIGALELAQALGEKHRSAVTLTNLANIARLLGDHEQALISFARSMEIHRELANKPGIAVCLRNMGISANELGDPARAADLSRQALQLFNELGDKQNIATTLNGLAVMARDAGDYQAARRYAEDSLALFRELGDRGGQASALYNLGEAVAAQGDRQAASALMRESLHTNLAHGSKRGIAECLRGLALLEDDGSDSPRLVRLLAAAEAIREALGAPLAERERGRFEPRLERALAELGPAAYAAAQAEGAGLTPEQAVALVEGAGNAALAVANLPGTEPPAARAAAPASSLSGRELEVLRLVAAGLSNAAIASQLHLSVNTVQTHLRSIFGKIDVSSRSAAVRYAFEHGLR